MQVLAQHSVVLRHPAERVVALVGARGHRWSVALDGDPLGLLAKVGVRVGQVPVYKHVRLLVGEAAAPPGADRLMLPVSWEAVGGPPIFPGMEGTLHVAPAAEGALLTLNAVYDPPLGALGELLDRAVMNRLAQASIADFVIRLAEEIEAELAAGS